MAIIFSQSKKYRDLSLFDIAELTEEESWQKFKKLRWGDGDETICPNCLTPGKHYFIKTRKQWTCKSCSHRYSVTSSTPFSSHKLSLKKILYLIYFFVAGSQGQSVNGLHSKTKMTLRTVFHNFGKIREVLFETTNQNPLKGLVHIDCAHFCGKPRRATVRKKTDSVVVNSILRNRKDAIVPDTKTHPEPWNIEKLKKRRILLALSQADPNSYEGKGSDRTLFFVIKNENAATITPIIEKYVDRNAIIWSDCGSAFNQIETELGNPHHKVNHSVEYQTIDGVNNNFAESYFSRLRRAEFGVYNGMRPQYLSFYAAEFAWRNLMKKSSISEKFNDVLKKALSRETSKAFCGYNQGHRLGFEYVII